MPTKAQKILKKIGSLRKLAEEIGVSHSTISRKLRGETGMGVDFARSISNLRPVSAKDIMTLPLLFEKSEG